MSARRQLADGRTSRGYVPAEVELVDAPISAEALGLMMRIRRDSSMREKDGAIDALALKALAVYCGIAANRLPKLIAELVAVGALKDLGEGGATDLNYATWGRTHEECEAEREKARGRKQRERGRRQDGPGHADVTRMSRRDTGVSHAPSHAPVTPVSQEESQPPSPHPSPHAHVQAAIANTAVTSPELAPPGAGSPREGLTAVADPRIELGDRLAAAVSELVAGGVLSAAGLKRVRNWPYAFQHLATHGEGAFVALCRKRCEEALARNDPVKTAQYFEAPLGEADAALADGQALSIGRNHVEGMQSLGSLLPRMGRA